MSVYWAPPLTRNAPDVIPPAWLSTPGGAAGGQPSAAVAADGWAAFRDTDAALATWVAEALDGEPWMACGAFPAPDILHLAAMQDRDPRFVLGCLHAMAASGRLHFTTRAHWDLLPLPNLRMGAVRAAAYLALMTVMDWPITCFPDTGHGTLR